MRAMYFRESNWTESMFNRADDNATALLSKYGVFNRNNPGGVVRDHKFSRRAGFELKLFPALLRHPVNCNIILHADNVRKYFRKENDCDISLEELFSGIESFNGEWKEQEECLEYISSRTRMKGGVPCQKYFLLLTLDSFLSQEHYRIQQSSIRIR